MVARPIASLAFVSALLVSAHAQAADIGVEALDGVQPPQSQTYPALPAPMGYEVGEYYTVAVVPVFEDEPGVHSLEIRTSIVYSDAGPGAHGAAGDGFDVTTDWYLADWSARLSLRYLSPLSDPCSGHDWESADTRAPDRIGFASNDLCTVGWYSSELNHALYTDIEASWAPRGWLDGGLTFTLGVNNLLEKQPRVCYPCGPEALTGSADPAASGQYYYARIRLQQ